MYLDAFWVGVFATLFVELAAIFVAAVIATIKRGRA
jgi:hypothetical protein